MTPELPRRLTMLSMSTSTDGTLRSTSSTRCLPRGRHVAHDEGRAIGRDLHFLTLGRDGLFLELQRDLGEGDHADVDVRPRRGELDDRQGLRRESQRSHRHAILPWTCNRYDTERAVGGGGHACRGRSGGDVGHVYRRGADSGVRRSMYHTAADALSRGGRLGVQSGDWNDKIERRPASRSRIRQGTERCIKRRIR